LCGLKLFSFDGALPEKWAEALTLMFRRRIICKECTRLTKDK
jgi:hypothetical protein